jgi:rhodanese-related sulfurtransferase
MQHSAGFIKVVDSVRPHIQETTAQVVQNSLQNQESFILIDTREDSEWQTGHIPTAIHISKGIIERDIENAVPDHNAKIVLYCGGGYRSALSAYNLQIMGYTNVISMDGGMRAWKELGFEVE